MLSKRIIACLDIRDGRVVKGRRFLSLRDQGDPAELARRYADGGADELVLLDIHATIEGRAALTSLVAKVARQVFIPITVGGGLRLESEMRELLRAGADKLAIQTAAVEDPDLIRRAAAAFGSQAVVVAIDARSERDGWQVFTRGGRNASGMDARVWAREAQRLGAGEILLTSIDADGGRGGYDLDLTRAVADCLDIPVIASGGAGRPSDLLAVLTEGRADAALAASIFHGGNWSIASVKSELSAAGLPIRC